MITIRMQIYRVMYGRRCSPYLADQEIAPGIITNRVNDFISLEIARLTSSSTPSLESLMQIGKDLKEWIGRIKDTCCLSVRKRKQLAI